VEEFDVIKYISPSINQGPVSSGVDPLSFQHPKETLASRIIATVTNCTRTADQGIATQIALVFANGELAATIRMQEHWCCSLSLPQCHFDRTQHHFAILPMMHRPANDQLAVEVYDNAQE
jgi:hypothetical protein